jgi:hypothetical protein
MCSCPDAHASTRSCPDTLMLPQTRAPPRQCDTLMPRRTRKPTRSCPGALVPRRTHAPMCSCPDTLMPRPTHAPTRSCPYILVLRRAHALMFSSCPTHPCTEASCTDMPLHTFPAYCTLTTPITCNFSISFIVLYVSTRCIYVA